MCLRKRFSGEPKLFVEISHGVSVKSQKLRKPFERVRCGVFLASMSSDARFAGHGRFERFQGGFVIVLVDLFVVFARQW